MTRREASLLVYQKIKHLYEENEANLIARYFIDDLYSWNDAIVADQDFFLKLNDLAQGRPLQYVTHKSYFYGHEFFVDERVLIPRPETEELVRAVMEYAKKEGVKSILDIGTGSGCIAITLKAQIPLLEVCALDISTDALEVASLNAKTQNVEISFYPCDILDKTLRLPFRGFDVIVSNPPYIGTEEINSISQNVRGFEPHLALFSPGDKLLFYKEIADWAKEQNDKTAVFMEINEKFGEEVKEIFLSKGYSDASILKDMQGKDRFLKSIFRM